MQRARELDFVPSYWLAGMTAWTFILSVLDGVLTIYWVLSDLAEEANPLMDYLIMRDPMFFMVVKIALMALGVTLLWRLRRNALAVVGILTCFVVYCGIMIHHLSAVGHLGMPSIAGWVRLFLPL